MNLKTALLVSLLGILIVMPVAPSMHAQSPLPPQARSETLPIDVAEGSQFLYDQNGRRFVLDHAEPVSRASAMALQTTGGPDAFGYTWDDSEPFDWIDATNDIDTGLAAGGYGSSITGSIPIGFDFKFYENSYSTVYISTAGAIGFDSGSLEGSTTTAYLPSPAEPNNFIAPYLAPLMVNSDSYEGHVYYRRGGTEPNRYFVAEWHQVNDRIDGTFTFEVVLFEGGDILFQYLDMLHPRGQYCSTVAGIESSGGLDGLAYRQSACNDMEDTMGKAVLFERPDPLARVLVSPDYQGQFLAPGEIASFPILVRNTGELGDDTYDLGINSSWPVALYGPDGITPLSDTDGDGTLDTGSLAYGEELTITAEVEAPTTACVGESNTTVITWYSSLDPLKSDQASLRAAVPAPFVQAYTDVPDRAMNLYFVQPGGQAVKAASPHHYYGDDVAIAESQDGFIYLWTKSRQSARGVSVREIEYAVQDRYGKSIRGVRKLTDLWSADTTTYDGELAVSVAPNGRVGVSWQRYMWSDQGYNHNIHFAIVDSAGELLHGPVSVTDNGAWGDWSTLNVPRFYDPRIAATTDNRFVVAWQKEVETEEGYFHDIFVTIRDSNGNVAKPVSAITSDTAGWDEGYRYPAVTNLDAGKALLAWQQRSDYDIYCVVLDSDGDRVAGPNDISRDDSGSYDRSPDVVQMAGGDIAVAWTGSPEQNPGETPWTARYYNNETLTDPPALMRTDETIDFNWESGSPDPAINSDHFSVSWTSTVSVTAGSYWFTMGSDDGSRLWIDGKLIMDHWTECCTFWHASVQLADGPHLITMEMHEQGGAAWAELSWQRSAGQTIRYVVLDGDNCSPKGDPMVLSNPPALTGNDGVSVTADDSGHAVLTWMDESWAYRRHLYYALIDASGNTVTDPMIFLTSQAAPYSLRTSYEGYGNTSYSWVPASGVDTTIAFDRDLFSSPPGGIASARAHYANHGATLATGVVLTATLDSDLEYVTDTLGIVPTIDGNHVTWELLDLALLESGSIAIDVRVPADAVYGARYPVTMALASDAPELNPHDNTVSADFMAARQVFLPLVLRRYW